MRVGYRKRGNVMRMMMVVCGLLIVMQGFTVRADEKPQTGREGRRGRLEQRMQQSRTATQRGEADPAEPGGRQGRGLRQGPDGDNGPLFRLLNHPGFAARLELSEEDREELIQAAQAIQQRIREKHVEMSQLARAQARLLSASELDEAAVFASVEAIGNLRTEIAKLRMEQLLLMRRRLSGEQLQKMRGFMQQQRGRERARRD